MEEISFYPIDFTYKVKEEKPLIYIYGRTTGGKQICVVDESFKPYFLCLPKTEKIEELIKEIKSVKAAGRDGMAEVDKVERIKKNLLGKKKEFLKVFTRKPADVPVIKNEITGHPRVEECFEYDIPFTRRYLLDKEISPLGLVKARGNFIEEKSRVPVFKAEEIEGGTSDTLTDFKMLSFDIETYNPAGKRLKPEEFPIIMLALEGYDPYKGEIFKKVITWKHFKTNKDYIEFVDGELDLIERFKEILVYYKPDLITGYFSDGFDFPYLIKRAKKHNLDLDISLDHSGVKHNKRRETVSINGLVHLDVFKFVRRVLSRSLETDNYDLDSVASEVLNKKKKEVDLDNLHHVWDHEPHNLEEYCEYNMHDAEITLRLCRKLMPNIVELVKVVKRTIFDVSRMSFSKLVESFIMSQTNEFKEVIPNRAGHDEIKERLNKRYQGAFVFQPKPGLYKNIVVFDFRSLYPTIITSHNIGPSTINCDCCDGEKVPEKGHHFCEKEKGFLPVILKDLITRRMRIKEIIKEEKEENKMLLARSEALKLLANSFYGYLGFYAARWYCFECAQSITAYGRNYIQEVIEKAEEKGFRVIYSDTDSIFLTLKKKSAEDSKVFVKEVNKNLPGLMQLEFEGMYPSGLFVSAKAGKQGAKKKYALLDEEGKLKITGFEVVRRNWSEVAKETQEEVLKIILKEEDKEKAFDYFQDVVIKLREHELPKKKTIIKTQLQKPLSEYEDGYGPHVAVAKQLARDGSDVGPGSMIKFIIAKGRGIIRERARLPEEVEDNLYDDNYYVNNQVIPAVERIFEVLGYNKEEIRSDKHQKGLGEFFNTNLN